jgi:hypothetical protein
MNGASAIALVLVVLPCTADPSLAQQGGGCGFSLPISDDAVMVDLDLPEGPLRGGRAYDLRASLVNNSSEVVSIFHSLPLLFFRVERDGEPIYPVPDRIYQISTVGIPFDLAPGEWYGGDKASWEGSYYPTTSQSFTVPFLEPGHYRVVACARYHRTNPHSTSDDDPTRLEPLGEIIWVRSEVGHIFIEE